MAKKHPNNTNIANHPVITLFAEVPINGTFSTGLTLVR
jgi:hypothetical protein